MATRAPQVACTSYRQFAHQLEQGEEGRIAADAYTTEHDCIVPYYGITVFAHVTPERRTWLISPDMGNGNLEGWIKTGETDDPAVYRQLVRATGFVVVRRADLHTVQTMDMIAGLNHLHAGDIVHGDIRAVSSFQLVRLRRSPFSLVQNNVFLWRESTSHGLRLRAKIADFGLARYDAQIKPEEKRTKPTVRSRGDLRHLGFEHLSPDKPFPNWQKVSVSYFFI